MKFFVESVDIEEIGELSRYGLIDGVATEVAMMEESGRDPIELLSEICPLVDGPVLAALPPGADSSVVEEMAALSNISYNLCVRLPVSLDSLRICRVLEADGYRVDASKCFSTGQALLAAKAGASFVSLPVDPIAETGDDPMTLIEQLRTIYDRHGYTTAIVAGAIHGVEQVSEALLKGADIAAIPPAILRALAHHPETQKAIRQHRSKLEAPEEAEE